MAITRGQMQNELVPGLHALFGLTYDRYPEEWSKIFEKATTNRSFEEEQKLSGFGTAPIKPEGNAISYDIAQEAWKARYNIITVAMGFAITEEAQDDNLYESVGSRYTKAMAFAFQNTKETICANVLNNGFNSSYTGGDGKVLFATDHPLVSGGVNSNKPVTGVDLSETALENAVIQIAGWTDERGLKICAKARKLVIPTNNQFTAERLLKTILRVGTADNDINAINSMSAIPEGYTVNHRLTDTNAWYIKTDVPDGLKLFQRKKVEFKNDGDFDTGNMRFKGSERFGVGWSDPLSIFGCPGV